MVENHYRWDFIGLSTDEKPTPETSEKVTDGSTFYCSDTSKLYVFCEDQWYEKVAQGGGTSNFNQLSNRPKYNGTEMTDATNIPEVPTVNDGTLTITQNGTTLGTFTANDSDNTTVNLNDTTYSDFVGTDGTAAGTAGLVPAPATTDTDKYLKSDGSWATVAAGPTVVQTTGTSTTDVMSQNAVTSMVFNDPSTKNQVQIGRRSAATGAAAVAIAGTNGSDNTTASGWQSVAMGYMAKASGSVAVAMGTCAKATMQGQFDIGVSSHPNPVIGYNNSAYRLLTGLYDGQSDHDAATVGQIKMGVLTTSPTGTTAGFPGRLYTLDTGGGSYEVYLCVHDNGDNTYVWKQVNLT